MLAKKLAFSQDVLEIVRNICKTVFNLQTDADIVRLFGISDTQMKEVINKITDSLPDRIFEHSSPQLLDEVKYISAREYIFFQVQEKWDDPQYKEDLQKFIKIFSRDILQRMSTHQSFQTAMKEEK